MTSLDPTEPESEALGRFYFDLMANQIFEHVGQLTCISCACVGGINSEWNHGKGLSYS